MATKMKMVMKAGKMVPAFAADGKGKMQMGGTPKYKDGGKTGAQLKKEGMAMKAKGQAMKAEGKAMKKIGSDMKSKTAMDGLNALAFQIKNMGVYKTGGMVNSNAKLVASKKATGKVGGISKAPKKAVPTKK